MMAALIIIGLCIPFMLLTAWAVVDGALRDFGSTGKKVLWIVIASIPFVGFLIYFIFGCRKGRKPLPPSL
jgi:uncharacterized membrane protein YhaH (DUF805 family)